MPQVTPIRYELRLEPRLAALQFTGRVLITLAAEAAETQIDLNILDLVVRRCRVDVGGRRWDCPFTVDSDRELLKISLPKPVQGEMGLDIDFEGSINDRMAGFYRSQYEVNGRTRTIAVTQFQESDARRAFPCFDHPRHKATFEVELIVEPGLDSISNGAVIDQEDLPDGRRRVGFERTPRMSTYLLFFGVGEFDRMVDSRDPRVRAAAVSGKGQFVAYGLDFGRKALHYSESYYGIPYPMSKLELIAVPDFAFGAMENWGAITFRENLLLYYPEVTSRAGEARICEVIAHEIAHQWFGNLVTPSDWKYLWLNESFATYFGYGAVDHYHPEWETWAAFLHGQTEAAFARDALRDTVAIEIPGGEHVVINTGTAPIIYSKGGSILRQVEGYVGADHFQSGLRHYLEKHAYGCATSHHLWDALETVSGLPVSRMMHNWVSRPGFPLVSVRRQGDQLHVSQRRFTYLPIDPGSSTPGCWIVPLAIQVFRDGGRSEIIQALMEGPELSVDLGSGAAAYKVNSGQTGFYRVRYEAPADLAALESRVIDGRLSPEDRWGLQNDLYALVRSSAVSAESYLDFLGSYERETSFLPLISISANLHQLYRVLDGPQRDNVSRFARTFSERVLSDIGMMPISGEPHPQAILREQLLWHAVVYGSAGATAAAREAFDRLRAGEALAADITKSVMQAAAFLDDGDALPWLMQRFGTSLSEHDRLNTLAAVGCVRRAEAVEAVLRFSLETVPDRNKFIPITALAANPDAAPLMWPWYRANLDALERLHPLLYERVIAAIVPYGGLGREAEVSDFFKQYAASRPAVADVAGLSLELLEINRRLRSGRSHVG